MATSQTKMLSSASSVHRKQSTAWHPPTYKVLEVMNLNKASCFSWQTKRKIILTKLALVKHEELLPAIQFRTLQVFLVHNPSNVPIHLG